MTSKMQYANISPYSRRRFAAIGAHKRGTNMRIQFSGEAGFGEKMILMNSNRSQDPIAARDYAIGAGLGLLTGVLLYYITEQKDPPGWQVMAPFFFTSIFLLLTSSRALIPALVFAAIMSAFTAGVHYVLQSGPEIPSAFEHDVFWALMAAPLLVYLSLTFLRSWLECAGFPSYSALFDNKIKLPIQIAFTELFALLLFGLFWLWAAMFDAIKIDFFVELFDEEEFLFPFFGFALGLSVMIIRGWDGFINMMKNLALLFSRLAMPVVALFSITFLIALAFTGLQPLWDTPSAARPAPLPWYSSF